MGLLPQVVLAAPEFDDAHLGAPAMANDRGDDLTALQKGLADRHGGTLSDQQDFAEFDGGTRLGIELFDAKDAVFGDPILFSARGDHCVHS